MDSALTIFFAVFTILILLFFCHVNLVIVYDKGLLIYYKILFVKIRIFPFKENQNQSVINGITEAKTAIDRLKKYRELSRSVFGFYYRALRLKLLNLEASIGGKTPAITAINYSLAVQAVSYLFKYFERNLILQIPNKSSVDIHADFTKKSSFLKTHFVIYTYLGPLVAVSFLALLKKLISFFRRILNGNFKAKRAN